MTNDQKVTLELLEAAIMAKRKDRRIKEIKKRLIDLKKTLEPVPWWKMMLRFWKRKEGSMKGFALIELMIVIAIIVILGAIAAPNIYHYLWG